MRGGSTEVTQSGGFCPHPMGTVFADPRAAMQSGCAWTRDRNGHVISEGTSRGGGRSMEIYNKPRPMSRRPLIPRSSSYNPDRYYGGNSETNPTNIVNQEGGKSKKSKKSRRSVIDYGSIMLYGGKSRKSRKSKKSRK